MKPIEGWVLWQESDSAPATWQWGTLSEGLSFRPGGSPGDGPWVTPGMVDVHAHPSLGPSGVMDADAALTAASQTLASGVTTIREPGSPVPFADQMERGGQSELTVLSSGRHIARPKRYLPGLAIELEDPSTLPLEVQKQAQQGDGWVKLVGDWIDRSGGADADLDPLWETSILIDAVAAAHESGARVAVHAFSRSAVDGLLEAGVDSIEHGSGMTRDHAIEAARRAIAVTPTLGQVHLFPQFAASATKYPVYAQTMERLYAGRHEWFQNLVEAGVQLLPGTDAGGYQPHGQIQEELRRWADYGMEKTAIVDAATWRVRQFLGFPSLSPGAEETFVAFAAEPGFSRPMRVVVRGRDILSRCLRQPGAT